MPLRTMQRPQPKTTYRGTTDSGETQVRKSFSVDRANLRVWKEENDNGTEVTYIEVPVSSTSQDRDGDAFSETGLENMKSQIDSGTVGMWLDHGLSAETGWPDYRVLEQIGGWKEATIDGETLSATAALRPSSEEAQELEQMIEEGVAPVSFSVGFIVESENERDDIPGKEFEQTDLLEISAVGIPSNPDAMVSESAARTAKAVTEAGGYDGDSNELARAISREFRSSLPGTGEEKEPDHDNENPPMKGATHLKQDGFETARDVLQDYLDAEDNAPDDPITAAIDWAEGAVGEDAAGTLEDAAQAALEATEEDSIENLTVEQVLDYVEDSLESQEEEEGEEEESETETNDPDDPGEGKEPEATPELRDAVRDALGDVLPKALTDEESLRELVSEEVRAALTEEELDLELNDTFVEELRSALYASEDEESKKPSPAGTIRTYDNGEDGGDGGSESNKNNGEAGNANRPSPAFSR